MPELPATASADEAGYWRPAHDARLPTKTTHAASHRTPRTLANVLPSRKRCGPCHPSGPKTGCFCALPGRSGLEKHAFSALILVRYVAHH